MGHVVVGNANAGIREASVQATVIRCGCSDPMSHANLQLPCPAPLVTEPLGTVSYWHKNPLRRFAWTIKQAWKEGRK